MKPSPRRTLDIMNILHCTDDENSYSQLPDAIEGYADVGEDVEESHLCAKHVNHGEHAH